MKVTSEIDLGGRKLTFEVGELAKRAKAAVFAKYGETIVLATVCTQEASAETDFLPLTVDYEERLYAGGRISTSRFIKREGRPSEEATLSARLIDRSCRPLFDNYFNQEVQIIITTLSFDGENDPQILAAAAVSAALSISQLPWAGPVGTVRVGKIRNELILNPTEPEMTSSDLDLVISCAPSGFVMIEAAGSEIGEEVLLRAFEFGQKQAEKVCQGISQLAKKLGGRKDKIETGKLLPRLENQIRTYIKKNYTEKLGYRFIGDDEAIEIAAGQLFEKFGGENVSKFFLRKILDDEVCQILAEKITAGERLDGRGPNEIREISARAGLLPRTHGSGLFTRGDTQVLSVVTLGSPALEQLIEGMTGEGTKRFMHHYNFPPFSTGEVRRVGSPKRREIGHGVLAEKALLPVIPPEEKFPYTIRVVSEILSSAGSTSMAAVSGSSLALMDAGVPILQPVAGVSIGSFSKSGKRTLITDIAYAEDSRGEMDFKVAGTTNGVTAIQMDLKIAGVGRQTLAEALEKGKLARLEILSAMGKVLAKAREKLSPFAPKVKILHIAPSQIGEVIGSGGRVIRQIMAQTGTVVDVEDDGSVSILGPDEASCEKAVSQIEAITRKVTVGEVFQGSVKKILPFGAMVEFLPGKEGLVHISQLAPFHVGKVTDVVRVGQQVKVKVIEIDTAGRINLSMLLRGEENYQKNYKMRNFRK